MHLNLSIANQTFLNLTNVILRELRCLSTLRGAMSPSPALLPERPSLPHIKDKSNQFLVKTWMGTTNSQFQLTWTGRCTCPRRRWRISPPRPRRILGGSAPAGEAQPRRPRARVPRGDLWGRAKTKRPTAASRRRAARWPSSLRLTEMEFSAGLAKPVFLTRLSFFRNLNK